MSRNLQQNSGFENSELFNKETIGGCLNKPTAGAPPPKSGGTTIIAFEKFSRDVLKRYGMDDQNIEATLGGHFIHTWLVMTDPKDYKVPNKYLEEVGTAAIATLSSLKFPDAQAYSFVETWCTKVKEINDTFVSSSSSEQVPAEAAAKKPTDRNLLSKLGCIAKESLSESINYSSLNPRLEELADRINNHTKRALNILINELTNYWSHDHSRGTITMGISNFESMTTEDVMKHGLSLEHALHINPRLAAFIATMKNAFVDHNQTKGDEHLEDLLTFAVGDAKDFEHSVQRFLELKRMVELGRHDYNEEQFVNRFIMALKKSRDRMVNELGSRMSHETTHRSSLNELTSYVRSILGDKLDALKASEYEQYDQYNGYVYNPHIYGKGKGKGGKGKGGKGKGGKGKGKGTGMKREVDEIEDINAFCAFNQGHYGKGKKQVTFQTEKPTIKSKDHIKCFKCGKYGHYQNQCDQAQANEHQEKSNHAILRNPFDSEPPAREPEFGDFDGYCGMVRFTTDVSLEINSSVGDLDDPCDIVTGDSIHEPNLVGDLDSCCIVVSDNIHESSSKSGRMKSVDNSKSNKDIQRLTDKFVQLNSGSEIL